MEETLEEEFVRDILDVAASGRSAEWKSENAPPTSLSSPTGWNQHLCICGEGASREKGSEQCETNRQDDCQSRNE